MEKFKINIKALLALRKKLSIRQRILFIVGLFFLINLSLLTLGHIQTETMDSVRGYVRGEGLWAKAQKNAVFHLHNYVSTGNLADYSNYLDSLKIPLGDRIARVQMQSDNPDFEIIHKAFLDGGNHPKDIPGMISFFLRFEHFPYMSDAIVVWTEADELIVKLQQLGKKILSARQNNDTHKLEFLLQQLDSMNWELADKEYQFSLVLSLGAHWVKNVLFWVKLAIFAVLIFLVAMISRRITLSIEHTENNLMVSENRFKSLYRTNMLGIIDWHGDGRILDANNAFLNMIGYSQDDIDKGNLNWRDLTPENDHQRDNRALSEVKMMGYCNPFEKEFIHQNGTTKVPVYIGFALLDGEHDKGICFVVDQTEQKHAQTEMKLSATVFEASNDGIMITDENKNILSVNTSWCKLTGFSYDDALGQPVANIFRSAKMSFSFYKEFLQTLAKSDCWQGDILDYKHDDHDLHVHLSINAVRNNDQKITHYVAIFTDITERILIEKQLRGMAHYDHLTNLANRSLFNQLLESTIQRAKRHSSMFAILFIDLDRFKPVNDLYGHEVGDKLLVEIANRFKKVIRSNDIAARLGGDEFVILLEELKEVSVASIIARKVIDIINQPVCIDNHNLSVGCSIGISLFPEDGDNVKSILHSADIAMYAAKAAGRNGYFYFNSDDEFKLTK